MLLLRSGVRILGIVSCSLLGRGVGVYRVGREVGCFGLELRLVWSFVLGEIGVVGYYGKGFVGWRLGESVV